MPQRPRHIPQRSCVVCRRKRPKPDLTRFVRDAGGRLRPDPAGRAPGRGAYLCQDPACWAAAAEGDGLARALRGALREADRALLREEAAARGAAPPAPQEAPRPAARARYPVSRKTTR